MFVPRDSRLSDVTKGDGECGVIFRKHSKPTKPLVVRPPSTTDGHSPKKAPSFEINLKMTLIQIITCFCIQFCYIDSFLK